MTKPISIAAVEPANRLFHAIKAMAAPEFTRKLSYDEQNALSKEAFGRYCDWLFAANEPATQRWARRESQRDHDKQTEIERGDSYEVNPEQRQA